MGALLSQLRCPDHLINFAIYIEEAWKSVQWRGEEDGVEIEKQMFIMIQAYVKEAIRVNTRNIFVKTHSFMDETLHLRLGENTVNKYNRKV